MNEKLKALLKKLGLSDEMLNQYTSDDEAVIAAIDIEKDSNTVSDIYKNVLKNDAVFVDSIKSQARAAVLNSKESKFMKLFGLTADDVSGLPEKNRYDSMIDFGFAKQAALIKAAGEGGSSDKSKEEILELNKQILAFKNTITEYDEVTIPKAKKDAETQVDQMIVRLGVLGSAQKMSEDLLVKPDVIIEGLMSDLTGSYSLSRDGSTVKLQQKDNPEMDVMVDNKPFGIGDAVKAYFVKNDLFKKSNGKPGEQQQQQQQQQQQSGSNLAGLGKAEEHAKNITKTGD